MYKIYLPRVQGMLPEHLQDAGIADLAQDQGPEWESVTKDKTPDGNAGMVISWRQGNPKFDAPPGIPPQYEWTASPPKGDIEKGAWYFGFDKRLPPGPKNFQRTKMLAGHGVTLDDHRQWVIPSAYYLPARYGLNLETGEKEAKLDKRFIKYCETAMRHAEEVFARKEELEKLEQYFKGLELTDEQKSVTVPVDDALDHAWEALSINYRINPVIATVLGLLTTDVTIVRVCCAAIDMQEINEYIKKNGPVRVVSIPAGSTI